MSKKSPEKSARKKQRREDAQTRFNAVQAIAPTLEIFKAGMNSAPVKQKVLRVEYSRKLLINAIESNRRKH